MRSFFILIVFLVASVATTSSCRKTPEPPLPDDSSVFVPCITYPGSDKSFDIVTFNVETFPVNGYNSVIMVASLLNTINADVYALQEVANESAFNQLLKLMPDYTGIFYLIKNDPWNLAYLVRKSEIEVYNNETKLLFTDSQYFPRPPLEIRIHHIPTNSDLFLINNHLKCCSGADNETSRKNASEMLKNYIDNSKSNEAVVVLGDLNEGITGTTINDNPFLNFINDTADFRFADMGIAKGSQLWWSYPSYPSHIDHILITNELFKRIDTTLVYKAAPCYSAYSDYISDHRPVGIRISGSAL